MNIDKSAFNSGFNGKYFGTDGFRGEPNISLTSIQAYKIGRFLGWFYSHNDTASERARILIGKDTRQSGYMFEYAIAAGITASGADAYLMHVTTTPSISYICKGNNFSCGIMITASHNPYHDNGIKIINSKGEKLEENITALIEAYLDGYTEPFGVENDIPLATGSSIGRIFDYTIGRDQYINHLTSLVHHSFENLKIGLDCANGSAYMIAENVFKELGAHIFIIGNKPNGTNINEECGSTRIERLQNLVKQEHLDAGFAFDGDADRCIAVDATGEIVDGDKIIYILASRFKQKDILSENTVALTIMSNMGVIKALGSQGIDVSITPVGDKYVYQRMSEQGYQLGGEQSGHVILKPYSVTGDGILTALIVADEMIERKASLSDLCADVNLFPQTTVNFKVKSKLAVMDDKEITNIVSTYNKELYPEGRMILRASGTEDLVRLTVEARDEAICQKYVALISNILKEKGYLI